MKLLILRGRTGGVGNALTGEGQLRLSQNIVSTKVKELLEENAVSLWPAIEAHQHAIIGEFIELLAFSTMPMTKSIGMV
jgi:hypothetical protein